MLTLAIIIITTIFFKGRRSVAPKQAQIDAAWQYVRCRGMNEEICVLVDYSLPSGCNRLWVWDFVGRRVLLECPVAHGRGRGVPPPGSRRDTARFSNEEDSWLSSLGGCRIAERYVGRFGVSYRLDGLDDTNSNVRRRNIVLHGQTGVPSVSVFPLRSRRGKGCFAVAKKNMELLDGLLRSRSDVLLLCCR